MSDSLMNKVIGELKEINFDGVVSLNLYNEPLLDDNLENNISYIKTKLPNCFVSFNSNGDYLTRKRLLQLEESGLDEIRITLHSDTYEDDNRKKAIDNLFKKLNLEYKINKYISKKTIKVETAFNNLNLIVMCVNWSELGNDRAGAIESLKSETIVRTKPCMKPFREIVITAEGNCYPCCNFFPNSETSKDFLVGNLSHQTIYDFFSSPIMVNFRKGLFDFSPKFSPCDTCNDMDNSTVNTNLLRKRILKQYEDIKC